MSEFRKFDFVNSFYLFETKNFDSTSVKQNIKSLSFLEFTNNLTTFYENNKILDFESFLDLRNHIDNYLNIFTKHVLKKESFTHRNSWFQAYKQNNHHSIHVHGLEAFEYSFVFFIQTSKDSSDIKFYNPGYPYCYYNDHSITPKDNDLVIFNSFLPHEVLPNKDDQRISLAGNIFIK